MLADFEIPALSGAMKEKITIKLSESACAVLTEMSRRGKVTPKAIARICVENTLAQSIDDFIAEAGDSWLLDSAIHPGATCRQCWNDVEAPGSYGRHISI